MRLRSVSLAATELNISQPAVSQRLRALEQHFGRRLIERTPTGFKVASDVEAFSARLTSSLNDIDQASTTFRESSLSAANKLRIALLSTFAQRWLIPRLLAFQQAHADIDIQLMTTSVPSDLERPDADISIRCGLGTWKGQTSEFLVGNQIFPIASPEYLQRTSLVDPSDLSHATCIRVSASPRDADWNKWLEGVPLTDLSPKSWQTYSSSTHAIEAAMAGLGVAMAHSPFVEDSLASGRLMKPFSFECNDDDGDYYLVHRAHNSTSRPVRLFKDWLIKETAASRKPVPD